MCDSEAVCDPEPGGEGDIVCVIDGELLVEAHDESEYVICAEVVTERLSHPVLV